jgi:hypothetical protein
MTRAGVAYELPTWAPHTDGSAPSLLPTPDAIQGSRGGSQHPEKRLAGGHTVCLQDVAEHVLMGTPTARMQPRSERFRVGRQLNPAELALLPTPAAHDSGNTPEDHLRKKPGRSQVTSLQVIVDHDLLSSGGRIGPPSNDGSTSPAEQPLPLPNQA